MDKFKKARTLKDIRNDPRVDEIWSESEGFDNNFGWWCYVKIGWQVGSEQMHGMHEPTIKDICRIINNCITEWPDDPDL